MYFDTEKYSKSWNFGFGLRGTEKYSENGTNFNLLDNDYIQLYGLELRDDDDGNGYQFYNKESHKL